MNTSPGRRAPDPVARPRRIPVGRIAALAAAGVGAFLITQRVTGPRFRVLRPGLEFAIVRGEPFCRRGSAEIAVLRLDPARFRLRVHHFASEPDKAPIDVLEWQRRTGALAVFNAGQYYPDFSYMGLLVSGGEVVSPRLHPAYKAALVASTVQGRPRARVLDLEHEPLDPGKPGWKEVAQSFMLLDRTGKLRARKSGLIAKRTIVADDAEGRLLVITTEGAYTLHEFAALIQKLPLGVRQAMCMDGGQEAELAVSVGGFRYASFGRWDHGTDPRTTGLTVPLPTAISISEP